MTSRILRSVRPFGLCALLAMGACSEHVDLRSTDGSVSFRYRCGNVASSLRAPGAAEVVRRYARLVVRDATFNDRDVELRPLAAAYDAGDLRRMEHSVVRYLCTHGGVEDAAAPRFPEPGSTPPDFVLSRADTSPSQPVRLRDARGNVVVLAFWATWCAPCREEYPELLRLHRNRHGEGVRVYLMLHKDSPAAALRWMRANGGTLPMLTDPGAQVAWRYRVRAIPATFMIDRKGSVSAYLLSSGHGLDDRVVPLLAGQP